MNCDTEECPNRAVARWSNGTDNWNTCEPCQEQDFGGWPLLALPPQSAPAAPPAAKTDVVELKTVSKIVELAPSASSNVNPPPPATKLPLLSPPVANTLVAVNAAVAEHAASASINLVCNPDGALKSATNACEATVNAQVALRAAKNAIDIARATSSCSAAVASGVLDAVSKAKDASDAAKLSTDIAKTLNDDLPALPIEPVWDIIKTFENDPIAAGTCDGETCQKPATCLWSCATEKWKCCLDCQELEFGGFPVDYKIPAQFLTTGKPVPPLPSHDLISNPPYPKSSVFADSDSDSDNDAPIPASISFAGSVVSPPPKKAKDNKAVTPSPQGPTSNLKKMQDKWIKEAQAIDRNAKIITKIPEAMLAIHTHLHNKGPMNITGLFESLKKVIPNAVLRKSIDKMVSNGDDYRGKGSPDNCLRTRQGKNSTSTLYFAFEEEPRNFQAQSDTVAEIEVTKYELKQMEDEIQRTQNEAKSIQTQPKNTALDSTITTLSDAVSELTSSRDEAAKHTVDKKALKKMNSAHSFFVLEWKKRKAKCITGLNNLESATDGVIVTKKCMAGSGQIDVESDERIAKEAHNTTKFKSKKLGFKKRKVDDLGVKSFIAVLLDKDSPRGVKRIYAEDSSTF